MFTCGYINSGTSSSYPTRVSTVQSTDESEAESLSGAQSASRIHTNAFDHPKTTRYNRPPRDKSVLDDREKIATRRSKRIQDIMEDKKKLDSVRNYIIHFIYT